jgi:hypothetical protein
MEPVIICEWGKCEKQAHVFVNMDNDTYAFCGEEHKEEFWEWICESGNY